MQGPCKCGESHGPAEPNPQPAAPREIEARYSYVDNTGQEIYQKIKYKNPKSFGQGHYSGSGEWIPNLTGIHSTLYHADELFYSHPDQLVVIMEGEKAVDAARTLGYLSTCTGRGAGKPLIAAHGLFSFHYHNLPLHGR